MPLPRALARFNKVATNRIIRPLAGRLPGFAVIVHRGRASGAEYRTPVNAWFDDRSVIVALTYGDDTDWLRNLKASGRGVVVARKRSHVVGPPEVIGAEGRSRIPGFVRPILRLIEVDQFAVMPLVGSDRPT